MSTASRSLRIKDFSDAKELKNFRITEDGKLKRREGYRLLSSFYNSVRAAVTHENDTYILDECVLYRFKDGICEPLCEYYEMWYYDSDEKAAMFVYGKYLYIVGAGNFYYYGLTDGSYGTVEPYSPVIRRGINSMSIEAGSALEPINRFTRRARVTVNPIYTSLEYCLTVSCDLIESVTADGRTLPASDYSLKNTGGTSFIHLNNSELIEKSELTVNVVLSDMMLDENRYVMLHGVNVRVDRREDGDRLLIWGGSLGSSVLYSELGFDKKITEQRSELFYFPEKNLLDLGVGVSITDMTEFDGRTVIASSDRLWRAKRTVNTSAAEINYTRYTAEVLTDDVGVSRKGGLLCFDEALYAVCDKGLYKISRDLIYGGYVRNEITLSARNAVHAAEFPKCRLFYNKYDKELWCYHSGFAMVIDVNSGTDYLFETHSADEMLEHARKTAFVSQNEFFIYDKSRTYDEGMTGIEANFVSSPLDFGDIFKKKDIYELGVAFADPGERAKILFTLENDERTAFSLTVDETSDKRDPQILRSHARLGRCHYAELALTLPGDSDVSEIREIMLVYREVE